MFHIDDAPATTKDDNVRKKLRDFPLGQFIFCVFNLYTAINYDKKCCILAI